ncbi:carboxypeptidase-like regulatory domain-containing protein [Planctomycetota bacterium]
MSDSSRSLIVTVGITIVLLLLLALGSKMFFLNYDGGSINLPDIADQNRDGRGNQQGSSTGYAPGNNNTNGHTQKPDGDGETPTSDQPGNQNGETVKDPAQQNPTTKPDADKTTGNNGSTPTISDNPPLPDDPIDDGNTAGISGRVFDDNFKPAVGMGVRLFFTLTDTKRQRYSNTKIMTVDAKGEFRFTNLQLGTYNVTLFKAKWGHSRIRWGDAIELLQPGNYDMGEIIITRTVIRGKTVSRKTLQPVGSVAVMLKGNDPNGVRVIINSQSDEKGEFSMYALPNGEFECSYVPGQGSPFLKGKCNYLIRVTNGFIDRELIIELEESRTWLQLSVMDEAGDPVSGAFRWSISKPDSRRIFSGGSRLDAEGTATLDGFEVGQTRSLSINVKGYLKETRDITPAWEGVTDVEFVLTRAKSNVTLLTGKVTNDKGQALPAAQIKLSQRYRSYSARQTTNAQGEFTITLPAEEKYELRCDKQGYAPYMEDIVADKANVSVNIVLRNGTQIFIRVTDPEGIPLTGKIVSKLRDQWHKLATDFLTLDSSGRVELPTMLVAGKNYRLMLDHLQYQHYQQDFVATPGMMLHCPLQLAELFPISGRITNKESGDPVPLATLSFFQQNRPVDIAIKANAGGEFMVKLPEGHFRVMCRAGGDYLPYRGEIAVGENLERYLTVNLAKGILQAIRMLDENSQPVTGSRIQCWVTEKLSGSRKYLQVTTDQNGHGEVLLDPAQAVELEIRSHGYQPLKKILNVQDIGGDIIEFKLKK